MIRAACWLKCHHPSWGAMLIHDLLRQRWPDCSVPCPRSLQRGFREAGLNRPGGGPRDRDHLPRHGLGPDERFFSIDEYGPFAVKMQGGRALTPPGQIRTIPQHQKSKGSLIVTAALELLTNQVTHFYSEHKNTAEMIKLLDMLLEQYAGTTRIFFSWDAASWHASKALYTRVEEVNLPEYRAEHGTPLVELAPLPACAQFLNVIESVFSGMSRAIIRNSDYESVEVAKAAIDRHFADRNAFFRANPRRAGKKIWA